MAIAIAVSLLTSRVTLNKSWPRLHIGGKDPTYNEHVDTFIEWQFWVHEYINELLKPIRQSQIDQKETPTLKLGLTLVLTVTLVKIISELTILWLRGCTTCHEYR